MTEDDLIARAMTNATRQLLSALFVHHATVTSTQTESLERARRALEAEIQTMGMEAVGRDGEKVDLTDALQASLRIVVKAALQDAECRLRPERGQHIN